MTLEKILDRTNRKLAGEMLQYSEIVDLLDDVVDEINEDLNSIFPVFSDLEQGADTYAYIPDKYIRSVIIPGVAFKYFVQDEEGERVASEYYSDYSKARATMVRDYIELVPEEFKSENAGYVSDARLDSETVGGVVLYDNDFGL